MKSRNSLVIISSIAIAGISAGCATLAPSEQRQTAFIENTTQTKATAYNRTLAYLGKNLGNSNFAIKMQDKDSGQIVTKMAIQCNHFRQGGDPKDYYLATNLDFQAKDNRIRLAFEDMVIHDETGKPVSWAYNQITDTKKAEEAKVCLEPVKAGILKAINGGNNNW